MAAPRQSASFMWRSLNGLLCLHKPSDIPTGQLIWNIKYTIPQALNKLEVRPTRQMQRLDTSLGLPMIATVTDYSDHPLVIGPRYTSEGIHTYLVNDLGPRTSGVCVVGLNRGTKLARDLQDSQPLRVYRVMGELGLATDTYHVDGKVLQRATYKNVHRPIMDKVLSIMQASHQRYMFLHAGVHLQSQAAYDLAVGGLPRPEKKDVPVVYGIKCVSLELPFFTIEITCINETEDYLLSLIHTIGMKVHSVARCVKIQCVRYGPFTLEHALLRHSWKLENFVENIAQCALVDEIDRKSTRRGKLHLNELPQEKDSSVLQGGQKLHRKPDPFMLKEAIESRVYSGPLRHQARRRRQRLHSSNDSSKMS